LPRSLSEQEEPRGVAPELLVAEEEEAAEAEVAEEDRIRRLHRDQPDR